MKHSPLIIFLLAINTALAQNTAKAKPFGTPTLTFLENKGQITDQYGNARHDIQYKVADRGLSVFIGNGQLHYQFSKAETHRNKFKKFSRNILEKPDTTPTRYTMYRLDMALEGANPHPQVIADEKQEYHENYHTTALHTDNGVVSACNKITYKNIYPHIDWALYIKDNKLEYDFIINPGGNVNDIKIKYNGATEIAHTEGNIKIKTPLGDISEKNLYAYDKKTGKPVVANFKLHNNILGFSIHTTYNSRLTTLFIDPTLAWGTYYGGIDQDAPNGSVIDNSGNIFLCGYTDCTSNIATSGAYQTTFMGVFDAYLAKFNNAGSLLWATYYGGSNEDEGYGVACDNTGNSYITGFTLSTNDIATPGAHQTVYQGGWDAFLAKFNSFGALEWGTYYGGGSTDWGRSITCDETDNIYMTGVTSSSTEIATSGSYQDTIGCEPSGNNAFLAKFNNRGTVIWATYFGGSGLGNTALASACDANKNIYIGGTVYRNNIVTTPGCYQDTSGGGWDCFIAKFDSACALKWSTYYGGDSGEGIQSMVCDDSLNVYATGSTFSLNAIATPGAYQTIYGGGDYDAFLVKFNETGAMQWATYYGGSSLDEGLGIAYDGNGNIYITGYTYSDNSIATLGSYQDTNLGIDNAFLSKFSVSGALLWATYYGGSAYNGACGVSCDSSGNIYLAGGTSSDNDIATPGSFQDTWPGGGDAFLVKFDTGASATIPNTIQSITSVRIYPSPNIGDFTVSGEIANPTSEDINIEILNAAGILIYEEIARLENGKINKEIKITGLAAGVYLMRLNAGSQSQSIKFEIQY